MAEINKMLPNHEETIFPWFPEAHNKLPQLGGLKPEIYSLMTPRAQKPEITLWQVASFKSPRQTVTSSVKR